MAAIQAKCALRGSVFDVRIELEGGKNLSSSIQDAKVAVMTQMTQFITENNLSAEEADVLEEGGDADADEEGLKQPKWQQGKQQHQQSGKKRKAGQ